MMQKLQELFSEEWFDLLEPFLISSEFKKILTFLKEETERGRIITPSFKDIFKPFRECPRYGLHTIILNIEPYIGCTKKGEPMADGLAFSSKYSETCPKNLYKIYNAIDESVMGGEGLYIADTNDLTKWARQGILLLNCSLTACIGISGEHFQVWQPFVRYVLEQISKDREKVAVLMIGRYAKAFLPYLRNKSYHFLTCEHPTDADIRTTDRTWKHNNVFADLTLYQTYYNNTTIKW